MYVLSLQGWSIHPCISVQGCLKNGFRSCAGNYVFSRDLIIKKVLELNGIVRITHVTQGLVLHPRLWDLLLWILAVNSTVLSDDPNVKLLMHRSEREALKACKWQLHMYLVKGAKRPLAHATSNYKHLNEIGETSRVQTLNHSCQNGPFGSCDSPR